MEKLAVAALGAGYRAMGYVVRASTACFTDRETREPHSQRVAQLPRSGITAAWPCRYGPVDAEVGRIGLSSCRAPPQPGGAGSYQTGSPLALDTAEGCTGVERYEEEHTTSPLLTLQVSRPPHPAHPPSPHRAGPLARDRRLWCLCASEPPSLHPVPPPAEQYRQIARAT